MSPDMRDLNVLFVIPKMGKGGAQRIVLDLSDSMVARGINVDLLIFYRTGQDQSVLNQLNPGVRLLNVLPIALGSDHENPPGKVLALLLLPLVALWWVTTGKLSQYQIVHCNLLPASFFGWLCSILQFVSGKPAPKYVETFHADLVSSAAWEQKLFFLFWKQRDALVVELRRRDFEIIRKKFPHLPVTYIPFGVWPLTSPESDKLAEYRKRYQNMPVILSITRLNQAEKRILDLIMVVAQFKKTHDGPFVYLLVGDGPEKRRARELVYALGLNENVEFTGYLDDISIPCAIARVFLIAGIEDLVGIAGLQAASLGVPVVSLQMDPVWENSEAIFFNSRSHEVLAAEMERLITDDQYYHTSSEYVASTIKARFSVDQMISSYVQLFVSITSQNINSR